MKKTVVTFGVISGLIVSLLMIVTIPFEQQIGFDLGEVVGYATMLAAFLLIYFGVRAYRDNVAGGSVRLGRAFAVGALIALISSAMYTATWEVIYFGFKPDFIEKYNAHQLESARAKGATPAELDKRIADGKKFAEMYRNPLLNVAITMVEPLPLGLIVALISAGILSRRRRVNPTAVALTAAVLLVANPVAVRAAYVGTTPLTVTESPKLPPGPEHARLVALSGTWDVELTFWFQPGRPGIKTRGTSTIRPLFDGTFIEEKIEGSLNGTPFTTLAWTGFNTDTRQYEATRIASTNTARIAETGTWDEQARHLELKATYSLAGDMWTQRTVIEPTSADTMVATSYLSFGKVPEWKAVEIRYTRKSTEVIRR